MDRNSHRSDGRLHLGCNDAFYVPAFPSFGKKAAIKARKQTGGMFNYATSPPLWFKVLNPAYTHKAQTAGDI